MDEFASKLLVGVIGGIVGSTITALMNYYTNLKQRRLTASLAEKKDLNDFLESAAVQVFDADQLMGILEELHGIEAVTEGDLDALFKMHNVDVLAATPVFLQKARSFLTPTTLQLQDASKESRVSFFRLYKEWLFHRQETDLAATLKLFHELIQETHRRLAAATEALRREIDGLSPTKAN